MSRSTFVACSVMILAVASLPQSFCSNSSIGNLIFGKAHTFALQRRKLDIPKSLLEDAKLKTDKLIMKYNYPAEKHFITTEDGYILGMHRIARPGGIPFLLVHGILDSSATYILMGPSSGLGYYLWDQGYDVWLGNVRGNRYSRKHIKLDPNTKPFWNFSFHEMGVYDLPAMIDYILRNTRHKKLFYVGHSQGTTAFFVMCSKRPEYNEKIILMHAMAPVAYLTYIKTPVVQPLDLFLNSPISEIYNELLPENRLFKYICFNGERIEMMCVEFLFMAMGHDYKEFNMTMFPVILGHLPAGASVKQFRHFFQIYHSAQFREYDYGLAENIFKYGKSTPPKYILSKVTAPVVLHYSDNDYICDIRDVDRLHLELGNVVGKYKVPIPEWNHIDFIWGISARKIIYELIVKLSKSLDPNKLL